MRRILIGIAALGLVACSSDSSSSSDAGSGGTTGTTATATGTTFAAGNFQLTTHAVDDKCIDGGLDLLFMPNGKTSPYDFANLTEFPAFSALPKTYQITLQAPFSAMTITLQADGAGKMKVQGAEQKAVVVDSNNYGDCKADMTVDSAITIDSNDAISMTATITITKWDQGTDQKCPKSPTGGPPPTNCTVKLDIKGARKS